MSGLRQSALLLAAVLATTGCITIDVLGGGEEAELVETVVRGSGGRKILLLDIDGVIGEALIIWTWNFLLAQGVDIEVSTLYQDNMSAMLLEKNGKASSLKRTRHMDIWYFLFYCTTYVFI